MPAPLLRLHAFVLAMLLVPAIALAGGKAGAPARSEVDASVSGYVKKRGFRPGRVGHKVIGVSRSGKSTRVRLRIGARDVDVTVDRRTGRLRPDSASALLTALAAAHTPQTRAGRGATSRHAVEVLSFRPGDGAGFNAGAWRPGGSGAPLGRPRAGQSAAALALDAVSLGRRGTIELRLGTPITKGQKGVGLRVRENGIGARGVILNQTPGLVEVSDGQRWFKLGFAGYKTAGDVLSLDSAIDAIPAGTVITSMRVTDAPDAPRTRGPDLTDGPAAAGAGKLGFDLVSVESVAGASGPRI